jgi:hypothetical protein
MHGSAQSISFTPWSLLTYHSATASAIVCSARKGEKKEGMKLNYIDPIKKTNIKNDKRLAAFMQLTVKVTLNLTLLPSLRDIGECHVILNGVWQWLKHESMNSPQPLLC